MMPGVPARGGNSSDLRGARVTGGRPHLHLSQARIPVGPPRQNRVWSLNEGRKVDAGRLRSAAFSARQGPHQQSSNRQTGNPLILPAAVAGNAARPPAVQSMEGGFATPQTIFADRFAQSTVQLLMSQVKHFGMTGSSTMTVTLIPGNLGKLRFTVSAAQNGVLAVSFQADTAAAQHLIKQHISELRSQLSGHGYSNVSVDVGAGGGSNGAFAGWQGGGLAQQRGTSQAQAPQYAGQSLHGVYRDAPTREGFFAEA